MKNILFVFLILLSIAIFSCKTNPGPITQIVASDSSSTTGELTIRVIDGIILRNKMYLNKSPRQHRLSQTV